MARFPAVVQWLILLLASLALGFGLQTFHIPAALLLGLLRAKSFDTDLN